MRSKEEMTREARDAVPIIREEVCKRMILEALIDLRDVSVGIKDVLINLKEEQSCVKEIR